MLSIRCLTDKPTSLFALKFENFILLWCNNLSSFVKKTTGCCIKLVWKFQTLMQTKEWVKLKHVFSLQDLLFTCIITFNSLSHLYHLFRKKSKCYIIKYFSFPFRVSYPFHLNHLLNTLILKDFTEYSSFLHIFLSRHFFLKKII